MEDGVTGGGGKSAGAYELHPSDEATALLASSSLQSAPRQWLQANRKPQTWSGWAGRSCQSAGLEEPFRVFSSPSTRAKVSQIFLLSRSVSLRRWSSLFTVVDFFPSLFPGSADGTSPPLPRGMGSARKTVANIFSMLLFCCRKQT